MARKKLFLAHYSGDAQEVRELALELRLHGIVPWVDKDGGFAIADECEAEARRAIREDCFGLLLYATEDAFQRRFILNVELDEALKARHADPRFALFAVPRRMGFSELARRSKQRVNTDLSAFHTVAIPDGACLSESAAEIASQVLDRLLRQHTGQALGRVSLQFSTIELMPCRPEDLLCIDATSMFRPNGRNSAQWDRLLRALRSVKRCIAASLGRPRLSLHGSKHLSAAFMFGRVFAPFEIDIQQTAVDVWRTDEPPSPVAPFAVTVTKVEPNGSRLFVEVASRRKNVPQGVDAFVAEGGPRPSLRLQLRPREGPLDVDNRLSAAMATQTYAEIERVVSAHHINQIHLFAAVPQSYMVMLGRSFRGMPVTYLYEWLDGRYVQSCCLPAGVL